jgi:hypothetical protein
MGGTGPITGGQWRRARDEPHRESYGSGQITWLKILWIVIRKIEEADFLTAEHERDIFAYDEARFLHRSETHISRVRGR